MNAPSSTPHPLAVVTGASSGIGHELAKQFAANGYDLIVAAEGADIVSAAQSIDGTGSVTPVQADLAAYDGVEELVGAIQQAGRPVDALVLNAGIGAGGEFAHDTDLATELRLIELNVASPVHLTKRVLPDMVARRSGRILFTSSIAGTGPGPYEAVYAASKAFLYSFSEAIRHEVRDTGVTVTALLPGPTETEFFDRAGMQDTKVAAEMKKSDPADVARQGYDAMMAGQDHIVAGLLRDKAQVAAGRVTPEPAKAKMHGAMTEPGSGDQS